MWSRNSGYNCRKWGTGRCPSLFAAKDFCLLHGNRRARGQHSLSFLGRRRGVEHHRRSASAKAQAARGLVARAGWRRRGLPCGLCAAQEPACARQGCGGRAARRGARLETDSTRAPGWAASLRPAAATDRGSAEARVYAAVLQRARAFALPHFAKKCTRLFRPDCRARATPPPPVRLPACAPAAASRKLIRVLAGKTPKSNRPNTAAS